MGGERRIWPHDATRTVTVRATPEQFFAWGDAARACGFKSAAVLLSRAGDWYVSELKKREGKR